MLPDFRGQARALLYGFVVLILVCGIFADAEYYRECEGASGLLAVLLGLGGALAIGELLPLQGFIQHFVDWFDRRETSKRSRKEPIFGDPVDTEYLKADNRPLPPELRYRVALYVGKRERANREEFERDITRAPSVNALLRRELEAGRL